MALRMAPHISSKSIMGFTGTPMSLLLLLLASSLSLAWGMAGVSTDPFVQYPSTDDCGPSTPAGSYSGHSCPINVCTEERKACDAANQIRVKCKKTRCTFDEMYSAQANATSACAAATVCVRSACYRSIPNNGTGGSCKVRSYYNGQCCCASCADDAPAVEWGNSYFSGSSCGGNGIAVPVPGSQGLVIGQCMWISAPGYSYYELSGCLHAYGWGWFVHLICLQYSDNPRYKYRLIAPVDGPGYDGYNPGKWYIYFTDAVGTRRLMKFADPSFRSEDVLLYYNSKKPTITKIQWSTTPLP